MKYSKRPKYKLRKQKIGLPTDKKAAPEDIYKERLMSKIRMKKR